MKIRIKQIPIWLAVSLAVLFSDHKLAYSQTQSVPKEKNVQVYINVNAPLDSVWSRWTTEKGLKKFFAPACVLDLKTFGTIEILFNPKAPAGQRGAENNKILAVEDKKMISFTWDAPPDKPKIREQRTVVTVRFYQTSATQTMVTLAQSGFGQGPEWQATRDYFEKAWGGFVLPNLKYSLEVKPVDWSNFPASAPQGLKPAETY